MLEAELTAYKQINLYLIHFALVKSFPGPKFMIDIWLWAFGSQLLKLKDDVSEQINIALPHMNNQNRGGSAG